MAEQKSRKNKQRLIKYSPKKWEKITSHNIYDQEEIIWRLENNLDITEIIDTMNEKYRRDKDGTNENL